MEVSQKMQNNLRRFKMVQAHNDSAILKRHEQKHPHAKTVSTKESWAPARESWIFVASTCIHGQVPIITVASTHDLLEAADGSQICTWEANVEFLAGWWFKICLISGYVHVLFHALFASPALIEVSEARTTIWLKLKRHKKVLCLAV